MKYFQIIWVGNRISLNNNDNTPILHTCLTSCWSCLCSTTGHSVVLLLFWVVRVKKQQTIASSWFHWRLNFLEKLYIKCSFIKRVWAVIFELGEVSISNFVKFRFWRMTLKIDRVFEKINNILSQKLAKRAMSLLTKKDHNKCKISYMRKKSIFL